MRDTTDWILLLAFRAWFVLWLLACTIVVVYGFVWGCR